MEPPQAKLERAVAEVASLSHSLEKANLPPLGSLQAHYAAKGKAKGSEALEPFADGLHEDGGETAEEEASENDMEVIPEEDEGDGDDGGGDD